MRVVATATAGGGMEIEGAVRRERLAEGNRGEVRICLSA